MNRAVVIAAYAIALVILAAGWWWYTGGGGSPTVSFETQQMLRAGPFRVAVDVEPETPRVGFNRLRILLADENGAPVDDARVAAIAVMPAMGAMAEMRAPADMARTGPGRYEGSFSLSMDGSWPLTLTIEHDELGEARIELDMATRRRGLEVQSGAQAPDERGAAAPAADPSAPAADPSVPAGTLLVDARRRQAIGLRTDEVRRTTLRPAIRAVGRVAYDETRWSDVSLRFDAWIGELDASYVGMPVARGQRLFTAYSPELLTAQQEYLEIVGRDGSAAMREAARRRLVLWGLDDDALSALEQRGRAADYVPIRAPRTGVLVEKHVLEGGARRAGETIMRIADLSRVWVEAQVYEADLALVQPGMAAVVTLPHLPGRRFETTVEYVYPFIDARTRTGRLRVSLPNADGALKPDTYAEVRLVAELGERLAVPSAAVVFAGERRIVFEDLGDGRLLPHSVRTGARDGEHIEILPPETDSGLAEGARVVTSGVFLIAAESRLQSGLDQW